MQDYLRQSRLGNAMDSLGFHAIAFILSSFWFILLWGVRFQSLLAGAALYGMIVILRKKCATITSRARKHSFAPPSAGSWRWKGCC